MNIMQLTLEAETRSALTRPSEHPEKQNNRKMTHSSVFFLRVITRVESSRRNSAAPVWRANPFLTSHRRSRKHYLLHYVLEIFATTAVIFHLNITIHIGIHCCSPMHHHRCVSAEHLSPINTSPRCGPVFTIRVVSATDWGPK